MNKVKVLAVLFFICLLFSPTGARAQGKDVNVSASIGEYRFTITGYTSPGAQVVIEGQGVYDETTADRNGRFAFINRFSPFRPREACITAQDVNGRITLPLCLPHFPTQKNVNIGPLLLPPSLSVDSNSYTVNAFGILSGKAAPESIVEIKLAKRSSVQSIDLTTNTDRHGNYSFTLPTQKAEAVHIFSRNYFKDLQSDKSLTLTFTILPFWLFIIEKLKILLAIIQQLLLPIILLAELLLIIHLVMLMRQRRNQHPLALQPEHELAPLEDHGSKHTF